MINKPPQAPISVLIALIIALLAQQLGYCGGGVNVGKVDITASSSKAGGHSIVYYKAHLVAANGASLDGDELRANLDSHTNDLQNVVAIGNVKIHFEQNDEGRSYDLTSDKGVYDPATNLITLTGNVVLKVYSGYTVGPLTQTGDSATVQIGKGPDFPQVTMVNVHTVFTPQQ